MFELCCHQSPASSIPPAQMSPQTKNSLQPDLSRAEVIQALNNLQVYEVSKFLELPATQGKDRLKQMKDQLESPEKIKKASANQILKLSSSLYGGCNFGGLAAAVLRACAAQSLQNSIGSDTSAL